MSLFRQFVDCQMRWSRGFDRHLPADWTADGHDDFVDALVPKHMVKGALVYDVGGGKNPFLSEQAKAETACRVTGVDISMDELRAAPEGCYDSVVCADIMSYRGASDGDIVICKTLLEHVPDVERAFAGLASLVKPGGKVLIFVPCRNAIFARLNVLLPERLKRAILSLIFPGSLRSAGFPSYYDRCTPRDFRILAKASGLEGAEERHHYVSPYFSFLFPAYLVWRAWVFAARVLVREQACETFIMALRKTPRESSGAK